MVGQIRTPEGSRYEALRHSQRVLGRMAPLVRIGLFAVGVSVFLGQVRSLVSDAQFTWGERRVLGIVALVTVGGFGLAGWVAGRLIRASADLIEVVIAGAESAGRTADLIELHVIPTLGRIAAALERERSPVAGASPSSEPEGSADVAASRRAAIDRLRGALEDARRADDPDRAIDCRDALTEHLRDEPLRDLDRVLVRWLVGRVQARAKSGTLAGASAAATLAARVAESFGDTPEAAGLRAALPGLRRNANLCPRCGRPHRGRADLCPTCSGAAPSRSTSSSPSASPSPVSVPSPDGPDPEVLP